VRIDARKAQADEKWSDSAAVAPTAEKRSLRVRYAGEVR